MCACGKEMPVHVCAKDWGAAIVPPWQSPGPAILSELLSRNILILLLAQAASVTGTVAVVTVGGILGRSLADNPALATLPLSMLIVATAVSTVAAAAIMSRIGRPRGFALGSALGAAGSGVRLGRHCGAELRPVLPGVRYSSVAPRPSRSSYRFAATESVGGRCGAHGGRGGADGLDGRRDPGSRPGGRGASSGLPERSSAAPLRR